MLIRFALLTLVLCGCNDVFALRPAAVTLAGRPAVTGPPVIPDAGVAGTAPLVGPELGPPCCDSAGARVSGANCGAFGCSCSTGVLCACAGAPAQFLCSDFCGSDALADPVCGANGWECDQGLIRTDSCAQGTCWGEPGDCCVNPQCFDGRWVCDSIADGGGCW